MAQTEKKHIAYWLQSAERSWNTAQDLLKMKHYDACLFFCHLTLEKILKALVVQTTKKPAPYIHDLAKLAATAKLSLTPEQIQDLRTITTFNISARYDEAKLDFYKQCTPDYTKTYFEISGNFYLWFKKESQKK